MENQNLSEIKSHSHFLFVNTHILGITFEKTNLFLNELYEISVPKRLVYLMNFFYTK